MNPVFASIIFKSSTVVFQYKSCTCSISLFSEEQDEQFLYTEIIQMFVTTLLQHD